jgi:glutamate formiminotransferase
MLPLVECVPNFSEGRDGKKVRKIAAAIESVSGAHVLDIHMDPDHNRSVITFAAGQDFVGEAAVRGVGEAVRLIDLNHHRGEHPRIGAADVVPFVPLDGVAMDDCISVARRAGEVIWERFQIPIYFYEAAALRQDRQNLASIRRGGFERLRDEVLLDPSRRPDIGGPALHATAGATVVGARKFLVAFNVNLNSPDKTVAQEIARAVRASSGGLPAVKAMGVLLQSREVAGQRGQAQVSMNLTDIEQTSLAQVYQAVQFEAAKRGLSIHSSELVGLMPRRAMLGTSPDALRLVGFNRNMILEERLAAVFKQSRIPEH